VTKYIVRYVNHTEPVKLEPGDNLWVATMAPVTLERHQVSTARQSLEVKKDVKLVEELAINLLQENLAILNKILH